MEREKNLTDWWKNAFGNGEYPLSDIFLSPNWVKRTQTEQDYLINKLKLKKGTKILDVCCGVGRHSIPLARKGFHVTGVDISKKYLDQAREQALRESLDNIQFIESDARSIDFKGEYDLALNMFSSLGYFTDPKDDHKVIEGIYKSLKPGGLAVLEIYNSERLLAVLGEFKKYDWLTSQWAEVKENGLTVLGDFMYLEDEKAFQNKFVFLKGDSRKEMITFNRLFTKKDLTDMFESVGFQIKNVFGNMDGSRYKAKTSPNLVIIAQKPTNNS